VIEADAVVTIFNKSAMGIAARSGIPSQKKKRCVNDRPAKPQYGEKDSYHECYCNDKDYIHIVS